MTPADAAQRAQALALDRHIITVAPAGSGKTGLLVQRFLAALATVDEPEQVVAITFTNKAAAEIRNRISTLLQRAAGNAAPDNPHDANSMKLAHAVLERDRSLNWDLAGNPGRLQASTIDAFNSRIAAELPLLSGLGGRPNISDDSQGLYEQALLAMFDSALSANADPALAAAATAWLRSGDNRIDRLLEPLTTLLSRRDQWLRAVFDDGWNDDALFGQLHVDYQRRFYDALGPADAARLLTLARDGSGHSEGLDWAAELTAWPDFGTEHVEAHRKFAQLLVTQGGTLRSPGGVNVRLGFPAKTAPKAELQAVLEDHADDTELEAAATALAESPPAAFPPALLAMRDHLCILLRHAVAELRLAMAARGQTDFGEIALAALQALRPEGSYGDALLAYDRRIRHLLVDEMQDTSEAQFHLLEELTQGWEPGDGHSLFLVGDPQQSIYAFRNARVTLFMQLWERQRLGDLELTRVQLSTNFRSTPALIRWFNLHFPACFPRRDNLYSGAVAYRPVESAQPDRGPAVGGVATHAFADPAQEAEAIAARAAGLVQDGQHSIAILTRSRTHLPAVLASLRARGLHYTCQDIDALQALPVVRDLLACAQALWHPQDRLNWAVLLRAPWVGLSWADLLALSIGRRDQPWPQRLRETPPENLSPEGFARVSRLLAALDVVENDRACPPLAVRVERLWLQLGGPACGDSSDLVDAQLALQLLHKHAGARGFEDLRAFKRAVAELYASPHEGAIQVMTIHKSKGLEFDHVLLIGCGRKSKGEIKPLLHFVETPHGALLVPKPPEHWTPEEARAPTALFDYAHTLHKAARQSESLRLLYVAATRAHLSLHLYASLKAHADGSFVPQPHSFAAALWEPSFHQAFDTLGPLPPATAQTTPQVPRTPRLPVNFALPDDEVAFIPRERRTLRPSESVLSGPQTRQAGRDDDGVYARLVGTLYHQAMQRIAENGIAAWANESGRHAQSLAAGLRRLGMPEPKVDTAVARVLELVEGTLQSRHGRWLLGAKSWARSEYALSGYLDGEWVAAAIDHCFEDEDGTLWIIDYKTTAATLAEFEVAAYIQASRRKYGPQLRLYAKLMGIEHPGHPVRAALYLAAADELVECEADNP